MRLVTCTRSPPSCWAMLPQKFSAATTCSLPEGSPADELLHPDPTGIGHLDAIDPRALGLGLAIAIGGLIVPFALELEGLRRIEPRLVAIIYSVDPAIAGLVGLVALGQHMSLRELIGMAAVVAASAG